MSDTMDRKDESEMKNIREDLWIFMLYWKDHAALFAPIGGRTWKVRDIFASHDCDGLQAKKKDKIPRAEIVVTCDMKFFKTILCHDEPTTLATWIKRNCDQLLQAVIAALVDLFV